MDAGRVSTRYARAIYEYALEKGEETHLYEEMKILTDNYFSFHALTGVMEDPTIRSEEKKKVLITAAGISVSNAYKKAMDLILENKRETFILFIAFTYQHYYRKAKGIIRGKLITAEPFSQIDQEKLKELIRQDSTKEIDFVAQIDPSVIGGFTLELDSMLLDASVKSQLNRLRYRLTKMNSEL